MTFNLDKLKELRGVRGDNKPRDREAIRAAEAALRDEVIDAFTDYIEAIEPATGEAWEIVPAAVAAAKKVLEEVEQTSILLDRPIMSVVSAVYRKTIGHEYDSYSRENEAWGHLVHTISDLRDQARREERKPMLEAAQKAWEEDIKKRGMYRCEGCGARSHTEGICHSCGERFAIMRGLNA